MSDKIGSIVLFPIVLVGKLLSHLPVEEPNASQTHATPDCEKVWILAKIPSCVDKVEQHRAFEKITICVVLEF